MNKDAREIDQEICPHCSAGNAAKKPEAIKRMGKKGAVLRDYHRDVFGSISRLPNRLGQI